MTTKTMCGPKCRCQKCYEMHATWMARAEKAEAEVERLRSTMRSFIDFMDDNLGTTADWPMEAAFDNEETCQRHCDHLNAMKRLVKPEDIN